ncbi:MAG TPA: hypothetical protein V6C91_10480 [Coleofasciculaceae cyanobacterium]
MRRDKGDKEYKGDSTEKEKYIVFFIIDADICDLAPNAGKPEFTRSAIRSVLH